MRWMGAAGRAMICVEKDPAQPAGMILDFTALKPRDAWRPQMKTINDLVTEMAKNLQEIPGLEYNFSQPIKDNVAENISGQFGQIAVKIYGEDLDKLSESGRNSLLHGLSYPQGG